MAKTKIADVIVPEIFNPYFLQRMLDKWRLFQSGVISTDPRINNAIGSGGNTINMPYWGDLTGAGESEVLSDSTALTAQKISALKDIAVLNFRGKAFSANELAGALAGSDPMRAIANQLADYWLMDQGTTLNNILKGVFATTLASTHVHDIASESIAGQSDSTKFSDSDFLEAAYLLGDRQTEFTAMAVHSAVEKHMHSKDLISYVTPSGQPSTIPHYRGRVLIVDDNVPTAAGSTDGTKYYNILFGPGAIGFGETPPPTAIETDRDSLAGDDYLIQRRHFVMHPRGVKWVGSPSGESPTNAEFATGGNWTKVYENKAIKLVAFITN